MRLLNFIPRKFKKVFLITFIIFVLFVFIICYFANTIFIYGDNTDNTFDITNTINNSVNTSLSINSVNKKNIKEIIYNGAKISIKSNDVPKEKNNSDNLKEPFRNILKNDDNYESFFQDILFEKVDDNHVKLISKNNSQKVEGEVILERIDPSDIRNDSNNISFLRNVCGYEDVKKELKHIADYVQKKDIYDKIGASLPRGYILHGPPGTGKTYFAKQLSEELDIPFIYRSGPEFEDKLVGEGNKKVRELFNEAEKVDKSCIIFIDEIDAVASKRGNGDGEGTKAHNSLINQFLTELDGFKNRKHPIIVIGATNKVDLLDAAITRPGRLEKKILVDLPVKEDCYQICSMYLNKIRLDDDLKDNDNNIKQEFLTEIVDECVDAKFSAAQFKRFANDSALLAIKKDQSTVNLNCIRESLNNIKKELDQAIIKPVDLSSSFENVLTFVQKTLLIIGIIFLILGTISFCLYIDKKYKRKKILNKL